MTTGRLAITRASFSDWPVIQGWCAQEGWNPGHADGPCFLAQDPEGFFLGRVDGEPVSAVSVVNYGDAFSFLGLYLVKPEYRGRGYGVATWRAALPRAGGRPVGLDGVVAQQENYRRSGFTTSHRHLRFAGEPRPDGSGAAAVRLADVPFESVLEYDGQCFPGPRPVFLREWFVAPGHITRALVVDGRLAGYGVVRPARDAARIGPLFADTQAGAAILFDALVAGLGGGPLVIDVPEDNPDALKLVADLGLEPVFECARMYTGPVREVRRERIFGVTSFELG